jgi:hypothetical protein
MQKMKCKLLFVVAATAIVLGVILLSEQFIGHQVFAQIDPYNPRQKAYSRMCESWMGANVNRLIMKWGTPTRIINTAGGGQIIIYEWNKVVSNDVSYNCTTQFAVDPQGVIRSYRWEGNRCWK